MIAPVHPQIGVNERGPWIAGTRISLYVLMDYIVGGWPRELIRENFPQISDAQFADAMAYIDDHRTTFETDYWEVVAQDEQIRREHDERNRERLAKRPLPPPDTPEKALLRAKLAGWKARLDAQ